MVFEGDVAEELDASVESELVLVLVLRGEGGMMGL